MGYLQIVAALSLSFFQQFIRKLMEIHIKKLTVTLASQLIQIEDIL